MLGKFWRFLFGPSAPSGAPSAARSTPLPSRGTSSGATSSISAAPALTAHVRRTQEWIPFQQSVRIGTMELPRGGLYVGLPGVGPSDVECSIDPTLSFSLSKPDWFGHGIGYWPRYANLSEAERGTFLAFMHSPRRAAGVGLSYVFLYLYQLEHRILRDAPRGLVPEAEARQIVDELSGLLQAYSAKSGSLQKYAGELLGVAFLRFPSLVPDVPVPGAGWTLAQKIGLAAAAQRGPLSAEWAFVWASSFLPTVGGAAWSGMRAELREVFANRYRISPLAQRPPKIVRSRLRVIYSWAVSGYRNESIECDWPDYAAAATPSIPFQALLQATCDDLEAMRKARRSSAPAGVALAAAPPEIASKVVSPKLAAWATKELSSIRASGPRGLPTQEVADAFGWIGAAKFGKREATQLAQALQALGIGMEPDPRFGSGTPKPGTDLTLFELPSHAERAPSSAYAAAHLMLTAAASVGSADGLSTVELEAALNGITTHLKLSEGERARLHAVLVASVTRPIRAGTAQSKVKTLPEPQRHALASVLVDIALADGQVSPSEIKLLERFYGALGLDPGSLHADLHHGSLGAKKPAASTAGTKASVLDADAISRKLEETARVQSLLAEIFVDDTPVISAPPTPAGVKPGSAPIEADALQWLADRTTVDRSEWDAFCAGRDALPDAALDSLNEWAIAASGEALLEGDDPLEVNQFARDQLASTVMPSLPA